MSATPLSDLNTCLQQSTWRHLLAIMASHDLSASTRWSKPKLVQTLASHLQQPATLTKIITQLHAIVYPPLAALLAANGRLPAATFFQIYGHLRPHRPWQKHVPTPEQPWHSPTSPSERLWYLGLIYLDPPRPQPGVVQRVCLPSDLHPLLTQLLIGTPDQPTHLLPRPGTPPDLLWHLSLWLATLAAGGGVPSGTGAITPLRGGWLPPTTLATLTQRLGLDQETRRQGDGEMGRQIDNSPLTIHHSPFTIRHSPFPRSERRHPYLAFLHHLATAANFIPPLATPLTLTPTAWQWLAAPLAQRWQSLFTAWQQAPPEQTLPFRFPWSPLTANARQRVLHQLRQLPLAAFTPLAHLVEQVQLHDHPPTLPGDGDQTVGAALITALCTGPLFWLGLLDLASSSSSSSSSFSTFLENEDEEEDEDEDEGENPITQSPNQPIPHLHLRLTPHGAWLLGLPDFGPPTAPAPTPCTTPTRQPELLLIPPTAAPEHLARLAPFCTWAPPTTPAAEQRLTLDPARIGQAVAAGLHPAQIIQIITAALNEAPSRRLRQRLHTWATAGQQVRIQPMLVLETADAGLMGRLRSRQLIRRHLGPPLSPTRTAIHPDGLPALRQTLHTLGLYVNEPADQSTSEQSSVTSHQSALITDHPSITDDEPSIQNQKSKIKNSPSPLAPELAYLLLQLYQGLSAHVELPMPLPSGLLDAIRHQLTHPQQATAASLAQRLLDQLAQALRGYLRLPAWRLVESPTHLLTQIQSALSPRQDLLITYWAADDAETLVRRITPYSLETRNGIPYLLAYCHLRQDERIFRLDRIAACTPAPTTA